MAKSGQHGRRARKACHPAGWLSHGACPCVPTALSHREPSSDGVGLYSHLCHGLGKVGRDGRQPLAPTVHNAVAASAHGRAGARGQAAELGTCLVHLSCQGNSQHGNCKELSQACVWQHPKEGTLMTAQHAGTARGCTKSWCAPTLCKRHAAPRAQTDAPFVTLIEWWCPHVVPTPGTVLT